MALDQVNSFKPNSIHQVFSYIGTQKNKMKGYVYEFHKKWIKMNKNEYKNIK
jgi:hypothetical protein